MAVAAVVNIRRVCQLELMDSDGHQLRRLHNIKLILGCAQVVFEVLRRPAGERDRQRTSQIFEQRRFRANRAVTNSWRWVLAITARTIVTAWQSVTAEMGAGSAGSVRSPLGGGP
jgi:hypothetical protein